MRYLPGTPVIDISHHTSQYDLQQAAYLLLSAYKHFPAGTIHIVPVEVFAGEARSLILAEKGGFFFVAPDNGLLPLAFGSCERSYMCHEFIGPFSFADWMDKAGQAAASVLAGNIPFPSCEIKHAPKLLQPRVTDTGVECNILYVDRFENVVLDINREQFDRLIGPRPFRIKLLRSKDIVTICNNYSDVPEGAPLCRFNNADFLELALNHDKMASLLGIETNNVNTRFPVIRIFY